MCSDKKLDVTPAPVSMNKEQDPLLSLPADCTISSVGKPAFLIANLRAVAASGDGSNNSPCGWLRIRAAKACDQCPTFAPTSTKNRAAGATCSIAHNSPLFSNWDPSLTLYPITA